MVFLGRGRTRACCGRSHARHSRASAQRSHGGGAGDWVYGLWLKVSFFPLPQQFLYRYMCSAFAGDGADWDYNLGL